MQSGQFNFLDCTYLKSACKCIAVKLKNVNSLDPDQARHSVWPILGPNCLQSLKIYEQMTLICKMLRYNIMAWLPIQFLSTFSEPKQYSCCKSCTKQESLKMFAEQNTTEVNLRIVDACSGI